MSPGLVPCERLNVLGSRDRSAVSMSSSRRATRQSYDYKIIDGRYICNTCNRNFSRSAFYAHIRSCLADSSAQNTVTGIVEGVAETRGAASSQEQIGAFRFRAEPGPVLKEFGKAKPANIIVFQGWTAANLDWVLKSTYGLPQDAELALRLPYKHAPDTPYLEKTARILAMGLMCLGGRADSSMLRAGFDPSWLDQKELDKIPRVFTFYVDVERKYVPGSLPLWHSL